jgi:hypothetical protein
MRMVYGLRKTDSVEALLHQHEWLPIEKIILLHTASLIYTIYSSGFPMSLSLALTEYLPSHNLRSGEQNLMKSCRSRTAMGTRSFSAYAPSIWNPLPDKIKCAESRYSFKNQLKQHLLKLTE